MFKQFRNQFPEFVACVAEEFLAALSDSVVLPSLACNHGGSGRQIPHCLQLMQDRIERAGSKPIPGQLLRVPLPLHHGHPPRRISEHPGHIPDEAVLPSRNEHGPGNVGDRQLREPCAVVHAAWHGAAVYHAFRYGECAGRLCFLRCSLWCSCVRLLSRHPSIPITPKVPTTYLPLPQEPSKMNRVLSALSLAAAVAMLASIAGCHSSSSTAEQPGASTPACPAPQGHGCSRLGSADR
jgi:hypothetical protein